MNIGRNPRFASFFDDDIVFLAVLVMTFCFKGILENILLGKTSIIY